MSEYIDREKFLKRLGEEYPGIPPHGAIVVGMLCDEEPADVRPVVRGKWLMDRDPDEPWRYTWKYKCDQCGEVTNNTCMGKPRYNYCPMCGADMREEP